MFKYTDWLIHQEHYKDLLREAEQARLAQFVVSAQPAHNTKKKTIAHKNTHSKSVEVLCCNSTEVLCCNPTEITCCSA